MRDQARALQMLQETRAEADAFMRAFDQSGNIGHNKRAAMAGRGIGVGGNHAEMRLSVVKGYAAILGRAAEMREISVDFPAFGKPTRPTSASNFNSRRSVRSSPGLPSSCSRGA